MSQAYLYDIGPFPIQINRNPNEVTVLFDHLWNQENLKIIVHNWKLFFLFLNQNICCGFLKTNLYVCQQLW